MEGPTAARPYMPGYGVHAAADGSGLLPWDWAQERLVASQHYWLATAWPDGRPHVMPVWGVWDDAALWFSTGVWSRKARNIYVDRRCVVTTEDAANPVVVEGIAELVGERRLIERYVGLLNDKYGTDYEPSFEEPVVNATIRMRPCWAVGVAQEDFAGSATRWSF